MTSLLTIREAICRFVQKWDRFLIPVVRFCYALIVFLSLKQLFGYNESLYAGIILFGLAFICAFVPTGITYIIATLIMCLDVASLNIAVAAVLAVLLLVMYLLYIRLVPGKSWVILLSMVLLMHFPCCIPLIVAMFVGPVGIVPVACGIVLYFFSVHAQELQPLLNAATDSAQVNPLTYMLEGLLKDDQMLLYIVVFALVIMVTYLIYQSSLKHAWLSAIITGVVVMMIALLMGSVWLENGFSVSSILLGSLLSFVIAVIIQFFRCIVDYSRIEMVQFEDDDYYYYVKAVPKLTIAQKDVNVQKINVRRKK